MNWDVADNYFVIQKIKSNVRLKEAFIMRRLLAQRVEELSCLRSMSNITASFINAGFS